MPVFIRHLEGDLYLQSLDGWTRDIHEAADFETLEQAINFCFDLDLQDVQVDVFTAAPDCGPLPSR